MTLVVDASVVAKWVMNEDDSDRALTLRAETDLIAPSLIVAEVGNALWKAVRRGEVKKLDALDALSVAFGPLHAIIPTEEFGNRALELAIALAHPVYDCVYLALAERQRATIISADRALLRAAKRVKGIKTREL